VPSGPHCTRAVAADWATWWEKRPRDVARVYYPHVHAQAAVRVTVSGSAAEVINLCTEYIKRNGLGAKSPIRLMNYY
jgi:hypothetical protein